MNLNKIQIIGRLGKDPATKTSQKGVSVCRMSVATTDRYTVDDEKREETQWHTVVAFGSLAENCAQYIRKGQLVYVEGSMRYRESEYQGTTRYFAEIRAQRVIFLEKIQRDQGDEPTTSAAPPDQDGDIPF